MSDINQPPNIGPLGNIRVNPREGLSLSFTFRLENGAPRDMTGVGVFFEVTPSTLRKPLVITATTNICTLDIQREEFDTAGVVPGVMYSFDLVDESGTTDVVLWSNKFSRGV